MSVRVCVGIGVVVGGSCDVVSGMVFEPDNDGREYDSDCDGVGPVAVCAAEMERDCVREKENVGRFEIDADVDDENVSDTLSDHDIVSSSVIESVNEREGLLSVAVMSAESLSDGV
jgi:hypothetical protein